MNPFQLSSGTSLRIEVVLPPDSDDGLERDVPLVPLRGPNARRLGDLIGVRADLEFVAKCCRRVIELIDDHDGVTPAEPWESQAAWTAAVIAYSRCFATGKRLGLDEALLDDLAEFEGDARFVHQYIRDLRDKHVAHSVNPFEVSEVCAALAPDDAHERGVAGIATFGARHIAGDRSLASALGELATCLHNRVVRLRDEYLQEVWEEARLEDLDDLYSRAPVEIIGPDEVAVRQPRGRRVS